MMEDNFQLISSAVTDRGLSEKRPQNEDSYLEMPNLGLFAVADGVGGAQAGDVASQMAVEILGEAFMNLQSNGDAEEMMQVAIERANSAIYQMSSDLPQLATMATTVVALHVAGNIATIGHVGDSRLYRLDSKGSLYRETQDHSVVEEEVRAGRMTAAQAANHPSRNVISRALGAEGGVEVDMKTIMFDGSTKFLLCSDGITRHISDVEIRDLLITEAQPVEICAKMKEICYSRGAEDNLTAVVVSVASHPANVKQASAAVAAPFVVDDEATVANARQNYIEPAPADERFEEDEMATRELAMPAQIHSQMPVSEGSSPQNSAYSSHDDADDDSFLMEETVANARQTEPPVDENENTAAMSATAAAPVAPPQTVFTNYEADDKNGGGFGKILSSLLLLLLGTAIGAGGFYAWQTMNAKPVEVPQLKQMQSPDIPYTTFENNRRSTDANPAAMIAQFEKTPPRDASDFYLLGRAYLLDKRYEEAVKSFLEARNKLAEYGETANKTVLTTDITSGLLSAQGKAAFERELGFAKGAESANQANTNK